MRTSIFCFAYFEKFKMIKSCDLVETIVFNLPLYVNFVALAQEKLLVIANRAKASLYDTKKE